MDNLSQRLSIPTSSHSKTVSSIGGVDEDERSENSRNWEAMFEEGIESSEINDGVLGDGFLDHVPTQWRYDYAFSTPSGIVKDDFILHSPNYWEFLNTTKDSLSSRFFGFFLNLFLFHMIFDVWTSEESIGANHMGRTTKISTGSTGLKF